MITRQEKTPTNHGSRGFVNKQLYLWIATPALIVLGGLIFLWWVADFGGPARYRSAYDGETLEQVFNLGLPDAEPLGVSPEEPHYLTRLILSNEGSTPLSQILLQERNRDWSSPQAILKTILRNRQPRNEREKALCIFDYVHDSLEQEAYRSRWDCFDLWKSFNCYGIGHCEVHSRSIAALWQLAGLKSRQANVGFNPGHQLLNHTMAEVYYDGAWRLFDSHGRNFFLGENNREIVGHRELLSSPGLIERSRPTGPIYAPFDHKLWINDEIYSWNIDNKMARIEPWPGQPPPHLDLLPGETVVYERDGGNVYVNNVNNHPPPKKSHSKATFSSSLPQEQVSWGKRCDLKGFQEKWDRTLTLSSGETGRIGVVVQYPYPIVSATVSAQLHLEGSGNSLAIVLRPIGHPNLDREVLKEVTEPGEHAIDLDLTSRFEDWNNEFVRYAYSIDIECMAGKAGGVRIRSLDWKTDCQYSTSALPRLSDSPWLLTTQAEEGRIRIAIESKPLPGQLLPPRSLSAEEVSDATAEWVVFDWEPVRPLEPEGFYYDVDLSDDPGFRWTLLPHLSYYGDRTQDDFRVPSDLFPEEGPFYFRVRVVGKGRLFSAWSETCEFAPKSREDHG